jgi:hypothetical protein
VFERIHTLVTKAANEASAALRKGDQLVVALAVHVEARRTRREVDPQVAET